MATSLILERSTHRGTKYTEIGGSPKFDCNQQHIGATSKWVCLWSDFTALATELFNYDYASTTGQMPLPMKMPGYAWLYAQDINIEPASEDSPGGYESSIHARLTIKWGTMTDIGGYTLTANVGGEFISVPSTLAKWSGITPIATSSDSGVSIGKLIPTVEYNINWPRVMSVPWDIIRSCIGNVNASPVIFLNGAPSETILFVGATITKHVTMALTQYSLDYKFSEKPSNWNFFLRPSTGAFERILFVPPAGGSGFNVYGSADLNPLVVPTTVS